MSQDIETKKGQWYDVTFNKTASSPSPSQDKRFWTAFAEIYHWPCVVVFDSWPDLIAKLDAADFDEMHECMVQMNKWRHREAEQNWCWVTKSMAANEGAGRWPTDAEARAKVKELYSPLANPASHKWRGFPAGTTPMDYGAG